MKKLWCVVLLSACAVVTITARFSNSLSDSPLLSGAQVGQKQFDSLNSGFAGEIDPVVGANFAQRGQLLSQHLGMLGGQTDQRKSFLQRNKGKLLALTATLAALGYAGHHMHTKEKALAKAAAEGEAEKVRLDKEAAEKRKAEERESSKSVKPLETNKITGEMFLILDDDNKKICLMDFHKESRGIFLEFIESLTTALNEKKHLPGTKEIPLLSYGVVKIIKGKIPWFLRDKQHPELRKRLQGVLVLTEEGALNYLCELPRDRPDAQLDFLDGITYFVPALRDNDNYSAFAGRVLRKMKEGPAKSLQKSVVDKLLKRLGRKEKERFVKEFVQKTVVKKPVANATASKSNVSSNVTSIQSFLNTVLGKTSLGAPIPFPEKSA